jgi:MFS family permease
MDLKKPAILSISLLNVMTNSAMAPILVLISRSFPESGPTLIRQVMTIPSLMIILFSIISGQLEKIFPKKAILAIGLCVYLISAFFAARSSTITTLIIFRAITGAGAGLFIPLSNSLITDFYKGKERAEMVGYSTFAAFSGAAMAPLLTGWISRDRWQNAFYIYFIAIIVLAFTMLFVPRQSSMEKTQNSMKSRYINASVLVMAMTGCLIYIIFYLLPTDISFLVGKIEDADPTHASALHAIQIIIAALAGVIYSHFSRKIADKAFPLGFILLSLGFTILFVSSTFLLLTIGMIIVGLGIGTLRPLILFKTSQASPQESMTTSFALVNSGFFLGQFISPFFYFSVTRIFSFGNTYGSYLFATISFLAIGILSAIITISKTSRPHQSIT